MKDRHRRMATLVLIMSQDFYYLTRARSEPTSDLGKAVLGNCWLLLLLGPGFVRNCLENLAPFMVSAW